MNGKNIRLRAIEPEDLDILYEIENDRRLWDVGATNVPYSRYSLHNYIASQTNDIFADRQLRLMIENEDGQTIGIVDLMNFDPQHQRAEIGIVVMTPWRRKGYAKEVIAQIVKYSNERLHLHQLYAFVATDNEASLRLFRKSGFVSGSVLTDWLFDGCDYHDALLVQLFL
ncbi:MAG: GNAT family N-acetyltransferase [Prevotella sp.]|nr:GNAT family N-acetyltransferase [Prevotella sp.]